MKVKILKTAFFDSGIGGLSVLHHAMKILPNEEFIFFADEDNVPYGTRTREQVLKYVDDAESRCNSCGLQHGDKRGGQANA